MIGFRSCKCLDTENKLGFVKEVKTCDHILTLKSCIETYAIRKSIPVQCTCTPMLGWLPEGLWHSVQGSITLHASMNDYFFKCIQYMHKYSKDELKILNMISEAIDIFIGYGHSHWHWTGVTRSLISHYFKYKSMSIPLARAYCYLGTVLSLYNAANDELRRNESKTYMQQLEPLSVKSVFKLLHCHILPIVNGYQVGCKKTQFAKSIICGNDEMTSFKETVTDLSEKLLIKFLKWALRAHKK